MSRLFSQNPERTTLSHHVATGDYRETAPMGGRCCRVKASDPERIAAKTSNSAAAAVQCQQRQNPLTDGVSLGIGRVNIPRHPYGSGDIRKILAGAYVSTFDISTDRRGEKKQNALTSFPNQTRLIGQVLAIIKNRKPIIGSH